VNAKESLLPVFYKPYHKIKENLPHWEELEHLWNLHVLVFYILLHIKTTEQRAYMNKMRLVDAK